MKARKPGPLYRRVVWWLLGYLALLSVAVFSVGNYVHEHAEHAAWRALLNSELDSIVEHTEHEPSTAWPACGASAMQSSPTRMAAAPSPAAWCSRVWATPPTSATSAISCR